MKYSDGYTDGLEINIEFTDGRLIMKPINVNKSVFNSENEKLKDRIEQLERDVEILEKQLDFLNVNTEQRDHNTNMTRTEAIEKLRCIFHKTRMTKHIEVPADVVHVILYGA